MTQLTECCQLLLDRFSRCQVTVDSAAGSGPAEDELAAILARLIERRLLIDPGQPVCRS
jgi:hypothetical protein